MKFLSFDIESNGLHGEAFSVAAMLITSSRTVQSEFLGRCPITGPVDPWVQANVLPPMEEIPENYQTPRALRDAFWEWFTAAKPQADFVLANNPYPVEARFLLACQEDDPHGRYTEHPFPLIDLTSLLLALGLKTRAARQVFMKDVLGDREDRSHNPRWDAWITALGAFEAIKTTGHL